jgi:hypothetical protein
MSEEMTQLTLTFDRRLSDEEIETLKQNTDALLVTRAIISAGSHHHHDDTVVSPVFRPSEDVTFVAVE